MVKLILMTDFTERYANHLLKGILTYSHQTEPWVICRMPPSFRKANGIQGVVNWAKEWHADAIIAQFEPQDDVSLFKKNGIIAIAQDYKQRFFRHSQHHQRLLFCRQEGGGILLHQGLC